jgi:hypothetical protein
MITTMTETTTTATSTTQVVVNRYQPKEPGLLISDGQTALLQRFGRRVKRNMTQGQASDALYRYFCSHIDEYVAYESEKRQKRQEVLGRQCEGEPRLGRGAVAADQPRPGERAPDQRRDGRGVHPRRHHRHPADRGAHAAAVRRRQQQPTGQPN